MMARDLIMIIAYAGMIIDHIGYKFLDGNSKIICGLIGVALPIMSYYIGSYYEKIRDKERYATNILLIGLISQAPWLIVFKDGYILNDVMSLLLGVLIIELYKRDKILSAALVISIRFTSIVSTIPAYLVFTSWYFRKREWVYWSIVIIMSISFSVNHIEWITWSLCPLLILLIERNIKGKRFLDKRIKYSIYPGHLYIMALLKLMEV